MRKRPLYREVAALYGNRQSYNPLNSIDNIQLALFPHLTRTMFKADFLASSTANADVVAQIDNQAGYYQPFRQTSSGREPVLGSDSAYPSYLDFGSGAGIRKFVEALLTTAHFNFFHNERTWSIAFPILPNVDSNTQHILTNARATGTDTGLYVARNSSNRLEVYLQNGTSSSGRNCTATLTVAQGWQVVILTCNAGALTVEVGSQASENHTFTVSHGSNAATSILRVGSAGNTPATDTYLQSKLAWLLVTSDILTAEEKTALRNWKPQRTDATVVRKVGEFGSLGFKAYSNLKRWFDFSDKTTTFQTTVASAVAVTAAGDPVGSIVDKASTANSSSAVIGRNAEYDGTAGKRPILEASAVNGTSKDLPVWDGVSGPTDTGADDELVVSGSSDGGTKGAKTQFIVARNRDNASDINSGSHYGKAGTDYWVMTSDDYQATGIYLDKRFVHHPTIATVGNEDGTVENDTIYGNGKLEVIAVRRQGTVIDAWFNGYKSVRSPQSSSDGLGFPAQIGPAQNPGFACKGPVAEWVEYNAYLTDSQITDIVSGLAAKYSITLDNSNPDTSSLATITTDASVNPTTTHITTTGSQNCVRVYTGDQDTREGEVDCYVSIDGATAVNYKLGRYQGRDIAVLPGSRVSFGTAAARTLKLVSFKHPLTVETPSGASGTANCDHAGPPTWTPTAAHVTLTAENSSIILTSAATRVVFVSESKDGTTWTPPRAYSLDASIALTVRTVYRYIALANYDGATLSVTAPTGATIGGTSATMTFGITKTGTTYNVTANSESDFRTKIALAVAGDEIVLPTGTYTLTANITDATFTANELLGNEGGEGVIIRSATGVASDVTVAPNNNTSGWLLQQVGATLPMYIKGITFNIASSVAYMRFAGGVYRLEDCRVTGVNSSGTNPSITMDSSAGAIDFKAIRCQADNSVEDCWDGNGDASDSYGTSIVQLIDCVGYAAGTTNDNMQCVTTHNGLRVEVWGGEYYDARLNVFECDGNATSIIHAFYAKTHDGASARRGGVGSFTGWMMENYSTALADSFTPKAGGYAVASRAQRTANAGGNSLVRYADSSGVAFTCKGNRLQVNDGRAIFSSTPSFTAQFNIVADSAEGIRILNSSAGSATPNNLYNNTIDSSPTALSFGDANNIPIVMYNNATKGSTTGISTTAAHQAATTTNFNTIDPTIDADFVAGASDTVSGDAALDSNYFPTASGNCDDNGKTDLYTWVGGTDYQGLPLLYKIAVTPRGARSRPIVRSAANLYPDAWI